MNVRSGNRFLLWALALSLAAHAAFALVARVPHVEAAPEEKPTRVQIVREAPPPTPKPTPVPTPRPIVRAAAPRHSAHVRVAAPKLAQQAGSPGPDRPVAVATAGAVEGLDGSPAPAAPTPTPKPGCPDPNAPAHTRSAMMPETPDDVAGLPATVQVQVTLDAAGRVTGAEIYRSSNDRRLDRAALAAARGSSYAPALVDCIPTGGTYLFRVDFAE